MDTLNIKKEYDDMLQSIRKEVDDAQAFINVCKGKIRNLAIAHCVIVLAVAAGLIVTGQIKSVDIIICLASVLSVMTYRSKDLQGEIPFCSLVIPFCLLNARWIFILLHPSLTNSAIVLVLVPMTVDAIVAYMTLTDSWVAPIRVLSVLCTFTTLTELACVRLDPADTKGLCCASLVCTLLMLLYATKTTGLNKCIEKVKHYQDIDAYPSADQLEEQVMRKQDEKLARVELYTLNGVMTSDTLIDIDSKGVRAEFTVKPDKNIKFLTSVKGLATKDALVWSVPISDPDSLEKYRHLPTRIRTKCLKIRLFECNDMLILGGVEDIEDVRCAFVTLCRYVDLLTLWDGPARAVADKKLVRSIYDYHPDVYAHRKQYFKKGSGAESSPLATYLETADKIIKRAPLPNLPIPTNEQVYIAE